MYASIAGQKFTISACLTKEIPNEVLCMRAWRAKNLLLVLFLPNIFIMKYNVCERSEPKFLQLVLVWPNIGHNSVHILQVY